jgi:allantoinase
VEAEHSAIELLVRLMRWCPTPVHVVHLSSATSIGIITRAKDEGLPLTVETCPHYLTFASEEIDEDATDLKCAPPIRGAAEREDLWRVLVAGEIDLIASDHSPCPPSMKDTGGDCVSAWGGIASLQCSLAAVWTGARRRGIGIERVVEWMCGNTAKLAGFGERKGRIAAGFDADIVIMDPDARADEAGRLSMHRHHLTPYAQADLYGAVKATYVGGRKWQNSPT